MPQDESSQPGGFTLIELLVVISIIALLSGMVLGSGAIIHDKNILRVDEAARGVERKLMEARNLATEKQVPYGVIFHIENAGTGKVLRNWDTTEAAGFPGRHWCAVVGPVPRMNDLMSTSTNPIYASPGEYGSAQRYAATVERRQVGERYYLPRGARFLALGDAEDNLHSTASQARPITTTQFVITNWSVGTKTRTGNTNHSDTYPRPWFGFLSGTAGAYTLNPWGGYDSAIYGSGLDYECTNRGGTLGRKTITNSNNSALCSCWEDDGRSSYTPAVNPLGEPMRPCANQSQLSNPDPLNPQHPCPRPLVNGYWQDFMILFLPNGQSRTLTFFSRTSFFSSRSWLPAGYTRDINTAQYGSCPIPNSYGFRGRDDAIIVFVPEAIGGTAVTIARDADDDNTTFATPQAALDSIKPAFRVIVNPATGGVRVQKIYTSIQIWLDDQERGVPEDKRIWGNGFTPCAANDPDPNKIQVSGAVTTDMLTQHNPYPWIKPVP